MAFSLYDATIPNFRQIVGAVRGLLVKAEEHCAAHAIAPDALIDARLAPDMQAFAYQVKSVAVHSLGAIEGVRAGRFSPDNSTPPTTFEALIARMAETEGALAAVSREEVDGFVGRDMAFVFGDRRIEFVAETFLMTFSLPNFFFHATTSYDILRAQGLPLGKRDFLGSLRVKGQA